MACLPTYKNKRYDNINELLEVIRAEMPTTFESSLKAFITPKKTSKPSFIDFPIIETEDIINFEGKKGAAQYDRDNKVIKVNRNLLKEKFKEKAWTKPRELMETLNGEQVKSFAQALPPDQFKTYDEWEQFVINHEYEHSLYSREDFDREFPNKTKGDYESEINRRALSNPRTFGISVSIQQPSRKTHSGKIEKLEPNQIFVFGSNIGSSKGGKPTHGSGAAKLAKEKFGAIQGQPRGLQGQSYAIVTKKYYDVERSSTPAEIIEELKGLYTFATQNPDKEFLVSDYSKSNLNGYTGLEMAKMFVDAGPIPSNVVLSVDFQKQVDSVSPVLQQSSTQGEIDNTLTPIKGLNERLDSYGYSELVLSPDFYKGEKPKVELSGFKNLFAILRENITRLADINWNTFDFILSKKDIEKLNSLKSIAKELDTINTLKINDNTTRTVDVEKRYAYLSNKLVNDFVDIISVYVEQQLGKTITSSKPRIITKAPVQTETQPTLKPQVPVRAGVEIASTFAGFQGYKGGFEGKGKNTPEGDGKDKAMRRIADSFIGEEDGVKLQSSTRTSAETINKFESNNNIENTASLKQQKVQGYVNTLNVDNYTNTINSVVMLARNGSLKNRPLREPTKEAILNAHNNSAEFIVGDMPGVDSQFIEYLQEIGAKFTVYHTGSTPRIQVSNTAIKEMSDISSLSKLQGDLMESEKGQIGVNKQQLLMLLGPTMYNKPLAQVAIKELLQNSFDAIKARMNITENKETGNINITVNYDSRTISIKDDGIGMTPDIVKNAFLSIGGTNKEGLDVSERSGGFGLAKVQFLLGSEYVKVITIRDGVKTFLEATAVQLYNDDFTINKEQTNEPNGSYVEVKIPESYTTPEGAKREIDFPGKYKSDDTKYTAFDILDKPLIGNVNVSFTHVKDKQEYKKVVPIGENTTEETLPPLFSKIDFDWGSADLYMSTEKKGVPNHRILSSGIYQFNYSFRFKDFEKIPYDIVVNIKPSVSSTSEQYPFNNQRENFKNTVTEDIKSLNNYLKKYASGEAEKNAKAVFSNITGLPKVDPNKVLTSEERDKLYADVEKTIAENKKSRIEQGSESNEEVRKVWKLVIDKEGVKDAETGKVEVSNEKNYGSSFKAEKEIEKVEAVETSNFNPALPQYHNNTNFNYLEIPRAAEFFSDFGSVVLEMVRFAGNELGYDYKKLKSEDEKFFAGVSIDKQYGGVHVRKIINAIFVNPLAFNVSSIEEAVGVALHVTIHEINHTTVSGEGANFTTALGVLYGKIYATGKYGLYEGLFRSVYKKHFETFKQLKNEYDKSSTRNLSESFSGDQIKKSPTGDVQRNVNDVSTRQSPTEGYTGNQEDNTKDKTGDVILSKFLGSKQTQPNVLFSRVPAAPVKPGVEELFEENKELANAVYEAAGFINTSEIQLDKPRFNPDNVEATSYPIKINNKYAGVISVDKDGYISSSIGMAGVELEKEFQNKGYGTKVYIALAEQLAKEGKTLKSEAFGKNLINESANRVWKSLLDKGYAIDRGNYYEVVNVITPQQKQQALQLYSSYLDTIFPDSKVKEIVYHGTDKEFDKFKKPSDVGSQNRMIAFADDFEYAKIAGNRRTSLKKVISALVNITKLYPVDKLEAMELDSGYRDEVLNEIKKEGVDGFAFESDDDLATKNFNEILVFEPEQIHILGSKQDIEGFKKYVRKEAQPEKETICKVPRLQSNNSIDVPFA